MRFWWLAYFVDLFPHLDLRITPVKMPRTIVTDVCERVADCVAACPLACIHPSLGKNTLGTDWYWIDFQACIDCAIRLQVCPVMGAIIPEDRPDRFWPQGRVRLRRNLRFRVVRLKGEGIVKTLEGLRSSYFVLGCNSKARSAR